MFHLGDLDPAETACRQAVALDPECTAHLYGLAELLRHRGKLPEAIDSYRTILSRRPEHSGSGYYLAALGGTATTAAMPNILVRTFFDGYAGTYDRYLIERFGYRAPRLLSEAVEAACGTAPQDWVVMNLGCGTGLGGLEFRDLARCLIGLDLSAAMIEKALAKCLYDYLIPGDMIEALDHEKDRFDLVVAAFVTDYFGDLRPLFAIFP